MYALKATIYFFTWLFAARALIMACLLTDIGRFKF